MRIAPLILAVDDDADMRRLISDCRSGLGFRVTSVPDGKCMRRHLMESVVDLLELKLAVEDGMTIAGPSRTNRSRQREPHGHHPVERGYGHLR
jgi:CheY-like chemotaxis protein